MKKEKVGEIFVEGKNIILKFSIFEREFLEKEVLFST